MKYNLKRRNIMNKKIISLVLIGLFTGLLAINRDSYAISAREIIDKAEELIRGDTQISIVEITIKTRRWTRTLGPTVARSVS